MKVTKGQLAGYIHPAAADPLLKVIKGQLEGYTNYTAADPLLKIADVIGDRKRGIIGLIPMSRSKWYQGISTGIFPPALHIGSGSYWRLSSIQAVIDAAVEAGRG